MVEKKIKVLVLTTTFPINIPIGKHILEKCEHLIRNHVDVTVIAPSHNSVKNNEIINRINVKRFNYFFPKSLQRLAYGSGLVSNLKVSFLAKIQLPLLIICFFAKSVINARNVDIIHCHWLPAGLVGVLIKKFLKKKIVLMMHHSHEKNFIYHFIVKNSDYIIANSSYVIEKTLKIYNHENNEVIPVAIDHKIYKPIAKYTPYIKKKNDVSKNEILIFSAGRFISCKGFDYLIKAMNIIINKQGLTNFKLIVAGDGPQKESYLKLILKFALQKHITIVPFLKPTEMSKYYNAADIFVIPSIIDKNGETEGLGLVAIEANACETPVIGSAVGGIVDVIENGKNGFLIKEKDSADLANKILELAKDPKLRMEMGKQGRTMACERFSWDAIVYKIIKVYEKLGSSG